MMSIPVDFVPCEHTIEWRGDRKSVHGFRYGSFCIRLCEGDLSDRWVITHLPTGLKIPRYAEKVEDAVAFVRDLQALRPDWAQLAYSSVVDLSDQVTPLMDRHCLHKFFEGATSDKRRKAAFAAARADQVLA